MRTTRLLLGLVAIGLIVASASCRSADDAFSDESVDPPSTAPPSALAPGRMTVLAAASLSDVFTTLTEQFEAANPGVAVSTSFAASSTLAAQVREGAPADVFAAADEATMNALDSEGLLSGTPVVFARNRIAIAVAPGNPFGITDLADLTGPGVVYVAAGPSVPITKYADQALAGAGVTAQPVSQEADVRAVLTKVASGEADAGIVYATDVAASEGGVTGIELTEVGIVAAYPAALLRESSRSDLAAAFVAFLTTPAAQKALADAGFVPSA